MLYHLLAETKDGYKLVKTYKKWAGKSMMNFLLNHTSEAVYPKVWVVNAKPGQLECFSSIGMPDTYYWTQTGWHSGRMVPAKLILKGQK